MSMQDGPQGQPVPLSQKRVPSLVGKRASHARAELRARSLGYCNHLKDADGDNEVTEQRPNPGEELAMGAVVHALAPDPGPKPGPAELRP